MFRFTRQGATWSITTPAGDSWRLLDGYISVYAGGVVVCVQLFGRDALLTADVMAAWVAWWQNAYC